VEKKVKTKSTGQKVTGKTVMDKQLQLIDITLHSLQLC